MSELAPGNSHALQMQSEGSHPKRCFPVTSLTSVSDSTSFFLLCALLGGELPAMSDFVLCSLHVLAALLFIPPHLPSHCSMQTASGEEEAEMTPCINNLGLVCVSIKHLGSAGSVQAIAILQLLSPGQVLGKRGGLTQSMVDSFN